MVVINKRIPKQTDKNPYVLLKYKDGWSDDKINENNIKFWKWYASRGLLR